MLTTHTFSSQVELVIRNIAAKAYEYRQDVLRRYGTHRVVNCL